MAKSYYEYLKEQVNPSVIEGQEIDKVVLYIPEFFRILCQLLDEEIFLQDRKIINSALAYFVVPNDMLPEDIYGIWGYMDDLYITASALDMMNKRYSGLVHKYWNMNEDVDEVLSRCIRNSERMLEEKGIKDKVIEFAGIVDD